MRFLVYYLIFLIVFLGCNNVKKQKIGKNDDIKTVIIPKVVDAKNVDIIYDLDYIKLEAKENSYFGDVSKLRIHKDRIYVLDKRYAKSLFIYTINGKHIATIGDKKGRGPLEFINLANFEIDYVNNQILTIDDYGYKFMIYDLDGNFVKRIDSTLPVFNAVLLPNGYFLHAKPTWNYKPPVTSDCQIIITDENKKIIKEGFDYNDNKNLNINIDEIISAQVDGSFNFAPKFRDTIYSVSFDSIIPKYAINFGNKRVINKNKINDISGLPELFSLIDAGLTCFMGTHVESNDYLYLSLGYFLNQIYVFFNKQTNKTIAISHKSEINEYGYELFRVLCSDSDGYFYGAFNFADIDELVKLFPKLKEIDIAAEDINPILFKYKVSI